MKRDRNFHAVRLKSGFTLIEMIGVLAVMTILSAILVPNVLKSIDAAAIKAEFETMANLGASVENYLRQNRVMPTEEASYVLPPGTPSWAAQIGGFSGLSAPDITFNRRAQRRIYLIDPALPKQRVIILSLLENNLTLLNGYLYPLPRQSDISSAARFQSIWDTADGSVPPLSSWGGWVSLNARASGGNFLIIQRVNLTPIYNGDLQTYAILLNNSGSSTVSYRVIWSNGAASTSGDMLTGSTPVPLSLQAKDRLNLYSNGGNVTLTYSYVVSNTPKTFTFTTSWVAQ